MSFNNEQLTASIKAGRLRSQRKINHIPLSRIAYSQTGHFALFSVHPGGYDVGMAIKVFLRKWDLPRIGLALAAVLSVALLAAFVLPRLGLRPRSLAVDAGSAVEVVRGQPLHVTHLILGEQPASLSTDTAVILQPSLRNSASTTPAPASAAVVAAAAATLPNDFYDFGAIAAQAVVRHDFLVINRGSAPLEIRRAYTTCGCTSADLSAQRIPPGKAALATVIFDAGFHPVAGQTVRRGLILETNDPDHPELEIWVQAAVK
jgi:hypothetical protein